MPSDWEHEHEGAAREFHAYALQARQEQQKRRRQCLAEIQKNLDFLVAKIQAYSEGNPQVQRLLLQAIKNSQELIQELKEDLARDRMTGY